MGTSHLISKHCLYINLSSSAFEAAATAIKNTFRSKLVSGAFDTSQRLELQLYKIFTDSSQANYKKMDLRVSTTGQPLLTACQLLRWGRKKS